MNYLQKLIGSLTLGLLAANAFCQGSDLPVRRVVLYRSGVGYVEHLGTVSGNSSWTLSLREPQMNDLLKSLVLVDFDGGQILPIQYTPRDPIARTLSAFAVDLSDNPSRAQLLHRLRGTEVEFQLRRRTIRGTVMSLEDATLRDSRGTSFNDVVVNLMTPRGLERITLGEVRSFRVLDTRLQSELEQALQVIGSGLDTRRKTIEIRFSGQGQRRVLVGYLTEMPQWKMTYRLVLAQGQPALLQGWAIVENTTDEDWKDIQLQLVSGRPVSFIQNLYEPFYPVRLRYTPPADTSLLPPIPQAEIGRFSQEVRPAETVRPVREPDFLRREDKGAVPPGLPGGFGGDAAAPPGAPGGFAGRGLPPRGAEMELAPDALQKSAPEMATGLERGVLFDYRIDQPVTIARQRSALVPVISRTVEAELVALYNANNHRYHPFAGIRLKNTTGLSLMDGPLTVYLEGAYGGDSLMPTIEPNGERFLLYALDVGIEVNLRGTDSTRQVIAVSIANGILRRTFKEVRTTTYEVQNRDSRPRLLVLEHPRKEGWSLSEPTTSERTADFYRFRLNLEPQKASTLKVVEEKPLTEEFALLQIEDARLIQLALGGDLPEAVRQALRRISELRLALSATEASIREQESRIHSITEDQARIRENMRVLDRKSALYQQYVAILTRQEQEISKVRQQLEQLRHTRDRQQQELNDYIAGLNL